MSERALIESYARAEETEIERLIEEARARLKKGEPPPADRRLAAPRPAAAPAAPAPEPGLAGRALGAAKAAGKVVADAVVPVQGQPTSVLGSVREGVARAVERAIEGGQALADIALPVHERPALPDDATVLQRLLDTPVVRGIVGAINVVTPFGAFAAQTGGDLTEWLNRSSGELTDQKLRAKREQAAKYAPGDLPQIDSLLAMKYEDRVTTSREAAAFAFEMLAGTVPGYTSSAVLMRTAQRDPRIRTLDDVRRDLMRGVPVAWAA